MVAVHSIQSDRIFHTWEDLHAVSTASLKAAGTRLADAIVVAVQDQMHCPVVLAFAEQGYDILCEKPMATSVSDCIRIAEAVEKAGIIFGMGHGVLSRYYALEIVC